MSGVIIDVGVDTDRSEKDLSRINNNLRAIGQSASVAGRGITSAFSSKNGVAALNNSVQSTVATFRQLGATAPAALERTGKAAASAASSTSSLATAATAAASAFAAIGASFAALSSMDSLTNLQNRLKLVTKNTTELIQTQQQLIDVSAAARSSFKGTVDTYFTLARALKQAGASQEELLLTTSTIQKAIAVSGTTAESAAAGLMQLSQGLSSGVLRGEELNSVMEQMPRLGQALSDSLGMNMGQLRQFAATGELTSAKVFNAIKDSSSVIASEFSKTTATFSQGLIALGDGFSFMVGAINQALGVTAATFGVFQKASSALFQFGLSTAEALGMARIEIGQYITDLKVLSNSELLLQGIMSGKYHFLDLMAVSSELDAMRQVHGYFRSISEMDLMGGIGRAVTSVTRTLSMSLLDLFRLTTSLVYSFGSLFHTFSYMIPEIRGPVQEITSTVRNSFITMAVGADAAAASVLRPLQRMVAGFTESLSFFLLWDTRVQRAWVDLAKSKGLQDLIQNVVLLGDALQTRNIASFWLVLYDKINFIRSVKEDMREVLMYLNLMDNRFLFINNVRFDRLIFALDTMRKVVISLFSDILYPKFAPAAIKLYSAVKGFVDAMQDVITDAISSIDASALGKGLASIIKEGARYAAKGLNLAGAFTLDLTKGIDIKGLLLRVRDGLSSLAGGVQDFIVAFVKEMDLGSVFDSLSTTLTQMASHINPASLGAAIGSLLRSALAYAGKTLAQGAQVALDLMSGVDASALSGQIRKVLATALGGARKFLSSFVDSLNLSEMFKSISTSVRSAVSEIDFQDILVRILQGIQAAILMGAKALRAATDSMGLGKTFDRMFDVVAASSKSLYDRAIGPIRLFTETVSRLFYKVWDEVVGHSYWPDTVEGIISWSKKLTQASTPIENFVSKTTASFRSMYEGLSDGSAVAAIRRGMSNIAAIIGQEWYAAAVSAGSIAVTAVGLLLTKGSSGLQLVLIQEAGLILTAFVQKFAIEIPKVAAYLFDVLGNIAKRYTTSLVNSLDVVLGAIPDILSGLLRGFGPLGEAAAGLVEALPTPLIAGLTVGFVMAFKELGESLPGMVASTLGVPLQNALGLMVRSISKGGLLEGLIFGKAHPASIVAGVAAIAAMAFDSVTALGAAATGVPLIYLMLLGDPRSQKLTTDIVTKVIPAMFDGIKSSIVSQITSLKSGTFSGLFTWMRQQRAALALSFELLWPSKEKAASGLQKAAGGLYDQLKVLRSNLVANWASYTGGKIDIWGALFNQTGGVSSRPAFKKAVDDLKSALNTQLGGLWGAAQTSEAAKHLAAAKTHFADFGAELLLIFRDIRAGAVERLSGVADFARAAFTRISDFAGGMRTKVVELFSQMGGGSRKFASTVIVALGTMALLFAGSANAASGLSTSIGGLAASLGQLVIAVGAIAAGFRLLGGIVAFREGLAEGLPMWQLFKDTILKAFADIAKAPFQAAVAIKDFVVKSAQWLAKLEYRKMVASTIEFMGKAAGAVVDFGKGVLDFYRKYVTGGALRALLMGVTEMFWSLAGVLAKVPKLFTAIGSAMTWVLGLMGVTIGAVTGLTAALVILGTVAVGFLAAGFMGDADFTTNIERAIDSIAVLVGLMDKPAGSALAHSLENQFAKLGTVGGKDNDLKQRINEVDFGLVSDKQASGLKRISAATTATLTTMQTLYTKHGKLTEEQAAKVVAAISMQQDALAALPQKAASFDLTKVTKHLIESLQVRESWFVGAKNIGKYILNSVDTGGIVSAGVFVGVAMYRGVLQGLRYGWSVVSEFFDGSLTGAVAGWFSKMADVAIAASRVITAPIVIPFQILSDTLSDFYAASVATVNTLGQKLSNIAWPDTGADYLKELNAQIEAMASVKPFLEAAEINQVAKYRQEFADAYNARYDGAAKTRVEEAMLDDGVEVARKNLARYTDELVKMGQVREEQTIKQSWADRVVKGTMLLSNSMGVSKALGFKDFANRKLAPTTDIFNEPQMKMRAALQAEIDDLAEQMHKWADISAEGVEIRLQVKEKEKVLAALVETQNAANMLSGAIEMSIKASGIEATKEQLVELYATNTEGMKAWLTLGAEIADQQLRLENATLSKAAPEAVKTILDTIKNLQAQQSLVFKVRLHPDIKTNYFEEFNKKLQSAGLDSVTADVFLQLQNSDQVASEIKGLFTTLEAKQEVLKNAKGFDAWITAFKEMRDVALQLKNVVANIPTGMGTTADFLGARVEQLGMLPEAERQGLEARRVEYTAIQNLLKTTPLGPEATAIYSGLATSLEARLKKDKKQFEDTSKDTGKGMAKSLTEAFSDYIKGSGITGLDIVDYAKLSGGMRATVDSMLAEASRLNTQLAKQKISGKPTEAQLKDFMQISQINDTIRKTVESANMSIEGLVASFGKVYDGFTIASWFELPAGTLADLQELTVLMATLEALLKQPKDDMEAMANAARIFNQIEAKKAGMKAADPKYTARLEASGLQEPVYSRISEKSQGIIADLSTQLKDLQFKRSKADGIMGAQYYQMIKDKQEALDAATAVALKDMPTDRTRFELSKIGVTVGDELNRATSAQLAALTSLRNKIAEYTKRRDASNDPLVKAAAQNLIDSTNADLKTQLAVISKDPAREAGVAYANGVTSAVSAGISSVLKGDKSIQEATDEFTKSLNSQVIDTFTAGLMEPMFGEGGFIRKSMQQAGSQIFGLGGMLGGSMDFRSDTQKQTDYLKIIADNTAPLGAGKLATTMSTPGTASPLASITTKLESVWTSISDGVSKFSTTLMDAFVGNSGVFSQIAKLPWGELLSGLTGALGFASGGKVRGSGTGTSDSIPAMLSNGEFVVNARSAGQFGPLLSAINSGNVSHLASGGAVGVAVAGGLTAGVSDSTIVTDAGLTATMTPVVGQLVETDVNLATSITDLGAATFEGIKNLSTATNEGFIAVDENARMLASNVSRTLAERDVAQAKSAVDSISTKFNWTGVIMAVISAASSVYSSFASSATAATSSVAGFSAGDLGSGIKAPSVNYIYRANGGSVFGAGTATSDSIPAMLSNGEFVVNARSAGKFRGLLEDINNGRPVKLAGGGSVGYGNTALAKSADQRDKTMFGGGAQTIVNLKVTGDISRQTKKEIYAMMPQIATGVNMTNKEQNYRNG
jgi:tape measure domain-containing protein